MRNNKRHMLAMIVNYYIGFITYGYNAKFDFVDNGGNTILLGELISK